MNAFLHAVERSAVDPKDLYVLSGMGCTGRIKDVLKLTHEPVTDSLPVERAKHSDIRTGDRRAVVFQTDADLICHGVDGFADAARAGCDALVIHVSSLVYEIASPLALSSGRTSAPSLGSREAPFNIPLLAMSCGARYVARWTPIHARRLALSIAGCLTERAFSVIEVVAPCLMYYSRLHQAGTVVDRAVHMERVLLDHDAHPGELDLRREHEIVVGIFRDH